MVSKLLQVQNNQVFHKEKRIYISGSVKCIMNIQTYERIRRENEWKI
jgi:Fe-S cluster assembly scaffold protein SufB